MNLETMTTLELLQLQSQSIDELRRREVVRTGNAPLGDYTEWLIANTLGWKLAGNSQKGFDATDDGGTRYQIKGRRPTKRNPSRQLSAIRKLDDHLFDFVIAVIFNVDFRVQEAWQIPHQVVGEYARFSKHSNGHLLQAKGAVLEDDRVMRLHEFE